MHTRVTFRKQSGVVLFITLIALVILLISSIALIRSTDTALLISGNLAVKRDLTNEAQSAIQAAVAQLVTGGLATEASRSSNLGSANYSATALSSNAQGVPTILFDTDANFTAAFSAAAPTSYNGVTYRYVIDRMCPLPGSSDFLIAPFQHCVSGTTPVVGGNARNPTLNGGGNLPGPFRTVVYRITVRATDARQTQSFIQTTVKSAGS
jgi:Tfp pilus assembly protein PilX